MRENEEALLGAIMRDGSLYAQAREIVQPSHFGNNAYSWAWEAMENLFEHGLGIDTITVGDELERMGRINEFSNGSKSGRILLSWLRSEGEPQNFLSYAENVQDLSNKRGLDTFFTKCVLWSKNGRRTQDIMRDVENELSKITVYSSQDEFTVPMSIAVSEAYDRTDLASQGKVTGVPTGFIDLNRIYGSFQSGNIYIIAGRPGMGKTALALSIAKKASEQGKRIALFSLEMSRSQVAQRLISQESEIDLSKIILGKMAGDEWENYTHAVEKIASLPIIINDLSSININQIRQTCRKIKSKNGLDCIIVDYIQLADSGEKRNERRELDVSAVSRGLKYLARELDVPVIAAAQLSRAVEQRAEKRPILSDLRESGSLEQDAYSVMFIHNPDPIKNNVYEIIIAKHRNGPVGSVDLIYKSNFTKFENATSQTIRFD